MSKNKDKGAINVERIAINVKGAVKDKDKRIAVNKRIGERDKMPKKTEVGRNPVERSDMTTDDYEDLRLVVKDIEKELNEKCTSIIILKTDELFGLNKVDKDTFIARFNELIDSYAILNMRYSTLSAKLKSILTNSKNDKIVESINNRIDVEITQLKNEYDASAHTEKTFSDLARFQQNIQDLSDELMKAKYEYTYVQSIDKNSAGMKNVGNHINVLVKDVYTLNQLIIPI